MSHNRKKKHSDLDRAKNLFCDSDVKITLEGRPFLGGAIGTTDFKEGYVRTKVDSWVSDIEELSKIATSEPHAAYYGYINSVSRRWQYTLRTIPEIAELLQPLEDAIKDVFIPALLGRNSVTSTERLIMSLPTRYGGLGILNPAENSEFEYMASNDVTETIKQAIINQATDFQHVDLEEAKRKKQIVKQTKKSLNDEKLKSITTSELTPATLIRALELASEKGSSAWLTTPPNKDHGFFLNKQEFRDAVCLRYGWKVDGVPKNCACGLENNIDHALTCKRGGYVIMRHNILRDTEATLMREACHDVKIEPELIRVENEEMMSSTATQDRARLDISARGVWCNMERVFFDIRVTHPNNPSNRTKSLNQIYKANEREKKTKYNERIIEIEKATFVPLVFTTSGGMGPECERFNKRLAELIALKRKEAYADVISYIRKKLRFALLRSTLIALRGYRGQKTIRKDVELSEVAFNLMY